MRTQGEPGSRRLANGALLLFMLMLLVSSFVAPLPQRAVDVLWPLAAGVVFYLLLTRWPIKRAALRWLWWGVIAFGALLALLAPPGMLPARHTLFHWFPLWAQLRPYLPDTFNPNVISGALVLLLPFGLTRTLAYRRERIAAGRFKAALALLATLAMFTTCALTGSRGAYLASAASLLVLSALYWPNVLRLALPLALVALVLGGHFVGWRALAHLMVTSDTITGLDQRVEIWSRAVAIIGDFPFTGAGPGAFEPLVARLYPLLLIARATVSHAHNLFLQIAVDVGLPGLAAYLVLLGLSFVLALRAQRAFHRSGWQDLALLSTACLMALSGMIVHGLLDAAVWGNKGAFLPWVVMGLCAVMDEASRRVVVQPR